MPDTMDGLSMDLKRANMDKLRAVFPECFAEGKLDIDKLLSLCGEYITNDFEKYRFEWKGKTDCLKLAQKRSTGTLRPCPDESVGWDTTRNLYIEGDNLEVLKLLQTTYFRKVKMIYIDPPYNTGNDFVYADDFADAMARYKEVTQQTTKSNPETMGRFHTKWLNMMYPRLRLAANLLRDDGVIFISIDDVELDNLKKLCNEAFGEENFIATVIWRKNYAPKSSAQYFSVDHDYILVYAKSAVDWRPNLLPRTEKQNAVYSNPDNDPRGPWRPNNLSARNYYSKGTYSIKCPSGRIIDGPPDGSYWRYAEEKFWELDKDGRIWWGKDGNNVPAPKIYLSEVKQGVVPQTYWPYEEVGHTQDAKKDLISLVDFPSSDEVFDTPKPVQLIMKMLRIATNTNDGDIVLDFFSGSATTGHAVMRLNSEDSGNRQFILVQLPEKMDSERFFSLADIGKERLTNAGAKILAEAEEQRQQLKLDEEEKPLPDVGFRVFKLDTTNLKTWDATPIEDGQVDILYDRMNQMVQQVKPERTDMDMVCEVMLKLGVPLTYPITTTDINGKTAYSVGEDALLLVCLASDVTPEDVEAMADYAPGRVVIARESFADDTAMANAYYILRDRKIDLKLV
ncbi:MAG: site-specific DNA-methyltransferase [Clostridium lundense]|nr:site-specific DNA-methyltransferase [Clostridium lundense]